jgi:hypothetical protein
VGTTIRIIIGGGVTTGIICIRIKMGVTTRKIIGFTITISITTRIKGKGVPLHAMEAHWGRGGIAPTHS